MRVPPDQSLTCLLTALIASSISRSREQPRDPRQARAEHEASTSRRPLRDRVEELEQDAAVAIHRAADIARAPPAGAGGCAAARQVSSIGSPP